MAPFLFHQGGHLEGPLPGESHRATPRATGVRGVSLTAGKWALVLTLLLVCLHTLALSWWEGQHSPFPESFAARTLLLIQGCSSPWFAFQGDVRTVMEAPGFLVVREDLSSNPSSAGYSHFLYLVFSVKGNNQSTDDFRGLWGCRQT